MARPTMDGAGIPMVVAVGLCPGNGGGFRPVEVAVMSPSGSGRSNG